MHISVKNENAISRDEAFGANWLARARDAQA
jgi:hypothetical protein